MSARPPDIRIALAETKAAILRCFPLLHQLRPHLVKAEFVPRVERQRAQGYFLACLESDGKPRAVAGYRFTECLAWGRLCYVDDLVTDEARRGQGYGGRLFDWVVARAREAGCTELHLDSGVHRFAAHRFYHAKRMSLTCHHFALPLGE